ncbi:MAG: inositol monophosphatase [Bacteroidia bacterium]|nr:inositol monophosphatase [Bacteroidia bacterium]
MDLHSICEQVIALSKSTGEFIREERKNFNRNTVEYKGKNDLVSYVDKTAEQQLVSGLKSTLAEAAFITEENTENSEGEFQWVIDPLDGTTNFVHGVPCFCISIALLQNKKAILGVIYEINLDECFYASQGNGAFLNGEKISVSPTLNLSETLMATGFPYQDYSRLPEYMQVFDHCMHHTHGLRRWGSAAVDLAYVACGRFDGFFEYGLNPWDVAAGVIIVEEAGGSVSDFSGNGNAIFGEEIIATNKNVFSEFVDLVKSKFNQ